MLLLSLLPVHRETAGEKRIVFDSTEWDFGEINVKDGPVNHIFHFRNAGEEAIVIDSVKTSCSCVQANIPEKTIGAGEEGVVQFVFNPKRTRGQTYRTIELFSDEGESLAILSITAECLNQ